MSGNLKIGQMGLTKKQKIFRKNLDNCFRDPADQVSTEQIEYNPDTFEEDLFDAFFALYSLYQDALGDKNAKNADIFDFMRTLYVGYNKKVMEKLDSHGN